MYGLNQNEDLINLSALIELMKGNNININFNINSNNTSNTTNLNNNSVTTVNNQGSNSEEMEKLKNKISDLSSKIETLEVQQSQTIEEHENLRITKDNHKYNENLKIPRENYENHENH